METLHASALTK